MRRALPGRSVACAASVALALLVGAPSARAATLEVGPGKPFARPCDAIAAAQVGDVVEVDAAGNYDGDTCAWSTDGLTVRGVNGRARIDATGAALTQQKGIFVIYAPSATIESFELSGAAISAANGNNGAAIRHQGLNLTVRDCFLHDNPNGILGGPLDNGQPADGQGEVLVERSELLHNGAGDGQSHNLYLNHYARFTLQFSWSHGADAGHLVKSRALESFILYNLLSDEGSPNVSYEVNLPDGGTAYVIGNSIAQAADPQGLENGGIVDFGSESVQPASHLFVVHNTLVNRRTQGATFVQVAAGVTTPAVVRGNVFVGPGTLCSQPTAVLDHNFTAGDPLLADEAADDFHLLPGSPCVDAGVDPGTGDGRPLLPVYQYVHPASYESRHAVGALDLGAFELGGGGGAGGAGAGGSGTGGGGASAGAGPGGAGAGQGAAAPANGAESPGESGGCGCRLAPGGPAPALATCLGLLLGAGWLRRRRPAA
ncbi:MAG: hypothetical protein HY908_30865 [Myxococcales bacterium]|nr:hypothetical protein [Myxococcales bacterium]